MAVSMELAPIKRVPWTLVPFRSTRDRGGLVVLPLLSHAMRDGVMGAGWMDRDRSSLACGSCSGGQGNAMVRGVRAGVL
jgi:hypothetical protein